MTIVRLREVQKAEPFKPFILQLADGTRVRVSHPELVLVNPANPRTFVVGLRNGGFKIMDLLTVVAIEVGNGAIRRPRRRQ